MSVKYRIAHLITRCVHCRCAQEQGVNYEKSPDKNGTATEKDNIRCILLNRTIKIGGVRKDCPLSVWNGKYPKFADVIVN